MGSRGDALSRCWANGRLRRALTAYLLFNINEWASWIALMVWAYDVHGVRGASVIAMSQVVPAALLASAAAARLGRMRAPQALRLGYALQAVMAAVVGAALLADASFALVCVLAAVGSVAITLTRPGAQRPAPRDLRHHQRADGRQRGVGMGGVGRDLRRSPDQRRPDRLVAPGWRAAGDGCAPPRPPCGARSGSGAGVPHEPAGRDERALSSWRVVVRDPAARLLSALVAAEYVLIGILDILLVVLALDQLGMSDAGPGVLNSALGIGGMIGAAVTVVLIGAKRIAPALVAGAATAGGAAALAGLSPGPAVAITLLAVCGAGKVFFDVSLRTFVQRLLPDHLLTAVFGLQESMMMAGLAVGALTAPLLVTAMSPVAAFVVAGAFLPVVAIAAWWRLARLDASTEVPADRLVLLARVPMLSMLAPRVVERLAVFSGLEQRAAHVAVVTEGETGDLFYVVMSGEVVVTHGTDEIRTARPGGLVRRARPAPRRRASDRQRDHPQPRQPADRRPPDLPHRPGRYAPSHHGRRRLRPRPLPLTAATAPARQPRPRTPAAR